MAITLRDAKNNSPQVSVGGEIQAIPAEIEDVTDAMIVGPSQRGPILVPKEIRTKSQFEKIFGKTNTYSSFCASQILEQTDRVKFTRVAATDGWNPSPIVISGTSGSDFPEFSTSSAQDILAVLILSDEYKRTEGAVPEKTVIEKSTASTPKTVREFVLKTFDENDNLVDEWNLSLNPFDVRYIEKILPPKIQIYQNFPESQQEALDQVQGDLNIAIQVFGEDSIENPLRFDTFEAARTPWITSQKNSSGESHRLFRVWNRSDGANQNKRFKVSIVGIGRGTSESGWPLFTLRLRDFEDTDLNQSVVEEFSDLSLNPNDERYIGKVIGTEYEKYDEKTGRINSFGVFDKQSLNIRIEISGEINRSTDKTLPFGFESYKQTLTNSSQIPVYRTEQRFPGRLLEYLSVDVPNVSGRGETVRENLHLGIEFQIEENENFFQGVPEGASKVDNGFQVDDYVSPDLEESSVDERKFTVGFQGGSDGQSIYREKFKGSDITEENSFGLDLSGRFTSGSLAYEKAFDLLKEEQSEFSFSLLSTPELDVQNHRRTIRKAEKLVRKRKDAFYVFDSFEIGTSPKKAAEQEIALSSTYAATYYGWVVPVNEEFDFVPPSAVIPQTYAKNDSLNDPWFAPAGPVRGVIPNIKDLNERLSRNQIDQLYENSINSIRITDPEGILALGNRCFTKDLSKPVSNIDVRRTAVAIVTRTKKVAKEYLFEQISQETAQKFRSDIFDILSTIQTRQGIRDYQVDISTPFDRGRNDRNPNQIKVSISFVPTVSSEYISVDFTIEEQSINVIS